MSQRNAVLEWMRNNVEKATSAMDLANQASDHFPNIVGIDSFVWDDAQTIWDTRGLMKASERYA